MLVWLMESFKSFAVTLLSLPRTILGSVWSHVSLFLHSTPPPPPTDEGENPGDEPRNEDAADSMDDSQNEDSEEDIKPDVGASDDEPGMWEESFKSHHDSKPYGEILCVCVCKMYSE